MVIRQEQVATLENAAQQRFEEEMYSHLSGFAPAHCAAIGENTLRKLISLGAERAATYGFTSRGPVRLFLELMIQLGTDFDSDPQLQWATQALQADPSGDQMQRADELYRRATNYLDAVVGPKFEYEIQALRRAVKVQFKHVQVAATASPDLLAAAFYRLHPEKARYLGQAAVRFVIYRAGVLATELGFATSPETAIVLAGLMYAFGHKCLKDPQYPWIEAGLRPEIASKGPELLFSRTIACLQKSLATLEARTSNA
ncbi:MAG TPA: hypothetical protein VE621_21675 [Bryobacteraceae bacterium]|nr:hypothetical protein [Bryobacteraceae bacterium]